MNTVVHPPTAFARALLAQVVDYAGLFPPAALGLAEAVSHYAAQRAGPDAWMLGRFVVPIGRLTDCGDTRRALGRLADTWPLSVVVGADVENDLALVSGFNRERASSGAVVDAIEAKAGTVEQIRAVADGKPDGVDGYIEVPLGGDVTMLLAAIKATGLKAKIRTGGVTPDAIPSPDAVVRFLAAAHERNVPFKATAGLHHPLRGDYRLTYSDQAPTATMFGYLNLLLAAATLCEGRSVDEARAVLCESDATTFSFGDAQVRWRDVQLDLSAAADTRAHQFISFGSCSFREPVDEGLPIVAAK